MDREQELASALEAAYLFMLGTPMDGYRARNQETFALVRDVISDSDGVDPEALQTRFEELSRHVLRLNQ